MKFKHGTRRKAIEYEKDLVKKWKQDKTFERSVQQRPADNPFVFYDGPPFLTGTPHHGHLMISSLKDAVARFWTMQGFRVERKWGWDCHGLPAEVFVEKQLGIKNKQEIGQKISIPEYVDACRAAMVRTGTEWEDTIDRIGRWAEFTGAYKTMDKEFMESVWWAFKQLYDKDLIYEGEKVLMYCTKDATPISKSEVAMENSYQDVTDPSVYVKFKIADEDKYLLAWTTTPWTLPSNSALAVNKDLSYAEVMYEGETFIMAEELLAKAFTDEKYQPLDYKVVKKFKGSDLVGLSYEPLFNPEADLANHENAFKVWHADFVHADEGTGIAHESPAYGEEDYELSREYGFPWIISTDENGIFTMGDWKGENVWDVNKQIAKDLLERGVVWKINYITHQYPHCHRCGTKLMYRAHPSWFMDIQSIKTDMLKANATTKWTPAHLQSGRFKHILETAPDWNLSRDRYWATPIPVWKGTNADGGTVVQVIGSYEEFKQLTGKVLVDYHLPNVMDVEFELDGVTMTHVGKVLDCWFESGSMPFAQHHYPFENKEVFEDGFPADFITEAIDQTRGWFYSLTAVNVGLFGISPYKNLICTGHINAADGKKLSKKLKNYTDPMELMDQYSVDAFRLLLLSSPLMNGENFALSDTDVKDVARKLAMVWNMYDFFTMYAEVDGWESPDEVHDPSKELVNHLDQWVVSRVHELVREVEQCMREYDIQGALKPVLPFIDDASNWFVRRSRKRFWKSEDDADKQHAYRTLHYVLVQLAHVIAPFTPFLADELYMQLTGKDSVHLQDWPAVGHVNQLLIDEMAHARSVVTAGLAERAKSQIKLRQPLAIATISANVELSDETKEIVREELNVKKLKTSKTVDVVELDTTITPELELEGLARELIRMIQESRKQAGLQVDDRIDLSITSDDEKIMSSVKQHKSLIQSETLTVHLLKEQDLSYTNVVKLSSKTVTVSLQKAQ